MDPTRLRRLRPKILLALVSLLLTLTTLELGSRWLLRRYAPRRLRDGIYVNTLPLLSGLTIGYVPPRRGAALPEARAPGELRVFVFGESSVAGVPWSLGGSPPTMLHDLLREAYPSRPITVVNMGRSGSTMLDTYYYLDYLKRYRPDLVIFYQGTNDRWDIGVEGCLLLEHPRVHAAWRWLTDRSALLWTAHVLGPSAFGAREGHRGRSEAGVGCGDDAFSRWSDLVVDRARALGARVIATSPVNTYAAHVDRHYRGGPSAEYQRLLQCRLTDGCNVARLLPDEGRSLTSWEHERLRLLAAQWQRSARRVGGQFIDFHQAQRAATGDDWLADAFLEDEVHLTLDGYLYLARFWLARTRALLEHRAVPDPLPPVPGAAAPYAAAAGERDARLESAQIMLQKGFLLIGATALRRYVRQYDDAAGRLAMGWLRTQAGLDSGLPPGEQAALRTYDPARRGPAR